MADIDHKHGDDAETIRAEVEVVFGSLRDLAAGHGTARLNQMVGYAYGYAEAMLKAGDLPEARKKLDWLKTELIAQSKRVGGGAPYVGGPFDGGRNPDAFSDSIEIRRGGSNESGAYVLTEENGGPVYRWKADSEGTA